jgi:hypothetical protein
MVVFGMIDVNLTRQGAAVWRQDNDSIVLRQFLQVIQELTSSSLRDSW